MRNEGYAVYLKLKTSLVNTQTVKKIIEI